MIGEPFFIIIYIVEGRCQLVVCKAIVWQVFDDDVFQFMKFPCRVAVVLCIDVNVVVWFLNAMNESFDVREECAFLVVHVESDVVCILIVKPHNQHDEGSTLLASLGRGGDMEGLLELLTDGRQLEVEEVTMGSSQVVKQCLY